VVHISITRDLDLVFSFGIESAGVENRFPRFSGHLER